MPYFRGKWNPGYLGTLGWVGLGWAGLHVFPYCSRIELTGHGHPYKLGFGFGLKKVPESQVGANQAVRIFVKFQSALSAQRAVDDLNGRYFGGRIVTATFFDVARFERLDLAPLKEEMINQSL
jgi:hypothetical protein